MEDPSPWVAQAQTQWLPQTQGIDVLATTQTNHPKDCTKAMISL